MLSLWSLRGRSSDRRIDEARTSPKLARATLQSARHAARETGRAGDEGRASRSRSGRTRSSISITASTRPSTRSAKRSAIRRPIRASSRRSPGEAIVSSPMSRRSMSQSPQPAAAIRSIAVLPLEDLSGDSSQDYFADGMTDELIMSLGQISALRVISRTSVMSYKSVRKPLAGNRARTRAWKPSSKARSCARARASGSPRN